MTLVMKLTAFVLAAGLPAIFGQTAFAAGDWEQLGCRSVGFAVDRDTIDVGRSGNPYKKIKLRVRLAPIEFYKVRVVFGNGGTQDIAIEQAVAAGSESHPIDLKGDERGIEKVNLFYRSIPTFKGAAEVCVIGQLD